MRYEKYILIDDESLINDINDFINIKSKDMNIDKKRIPLNKAVKYLLHKQLGNEYPDSSLVRIINDKK